MQDIKRRKKHMVYIQKNKKTKKKHGLKINNWYQAKKKIYGIWQSFHLYMFLLLLFYNDADDDNDNDNEDNRDNNNDLSFLLFILS